nr:hypothetical protein [uncultured Rhodoferax sp.]
MAIFSRSTKNSLIHCADLHVAHRISAYVLSSKFPVKNLTSYAERLSKSPLKKSLSMLRGDDKLFFLNEFSWNRGELSRLLGFIRMADFVARQLDGALRASGLSLNQAMTCHELAAWREQDPASNVGLSLKDLTTKLAASRSRLHAQLKVLAAKGIVRVTDKTVSKRHRGPGYVLTVKGLRQYEIFFKRAESAGGEVAWLLFHRGRKRHEAWDQMNELLIAHLTGHGDTV